MASTSEALAAALQAVAARLGDAQLAAALSQVRESRAVSGGARYAGEAAWRLPRHSPAATACSVFPAASPAPAVLSPLPVTALLLLRSRCSTSFASRRRPA